MKNTDKNTSLEKKIIKQCDQPEKLIDKIKNFLRNWCENTANHGFSNLVKTDSLISKLFWISILIMFFIYCFSSNLILYDCLFYYN